ncbi:MAG: hypothetical protein ACJATA_000959 [Sphingobacteriales bacterium]|jgi:hypothetical protein
MSSAFARANRASSSSQISAGLDLTFNKSINLNSFTNDLGDSLMLFNFVNTSVSIARISAKVGSWEYLRKQMNEKARIK